MVVYVTHDIRDAHIVAGRLTHEGIYHVIHTQPGASAMGITLGAMGEVKILVRPDDYDLAYDMLFPEELDELPNDTDDTIYGWDDDPDDE